MNIRVIGGAYGGRKLDTPPGSKTHPMGERIRNAVFNSPGDVIKGTVVLGAFAGTGAVGIEALSRGAKHATFVERDRIAQKCIQNNLEALQISNAHLVRTSIVNWLQTYKGHHFDVIFADPPYHDTQLSTLRRLPELLVQDGMLVVSWPEKTPLPTFDGLELTFDRVYAGARILCYIRA